MGIFPLLIMMVVVAHFVARLRGWKASLTVYSGYEVLVRNSVVAVLLLYPSTCTAIFEVFSCNLVTDTKSFLVRDLSLECWGDKHSALVSEGITGIFFYVIGIPVAIFCVLYKFRNRTQLTQILCSSYKPGWYYLECLQLLRKATLTGLIILVPDDSSARILLGSTISLLYFLFVALSNPYKNREVYCLDLVASFMLIVSAQGALALKYIQQVIQYADDTNQPLSLSAAAEVNLVGITLVVLNTVVFACGSIDIFKDELKGVVKRICSAATTKQTSDQRGTGPNVGKSEVPEGRSRNATVGEVANPMMASLANRVDEENPSGTKREL
jgi:hypothetical protein